MTTSTPWWFIPPPEEPEQGHITMQDRIEKDALLVYRCCNLAARMTYGGHTTPARQRVIEQYARKAYITAYFNLAEVRQWTGGLPLQLLATIGAPYYWQRSRQMVWVMGEIGKAHPLAYNLRAQLKMAINKWNEARGEVAKAFYIDEQDMGGDHG